MEVEQNNCAISRSDAEPRATNRESRFFHPRKVERLTSDLSNTLGDDELARREYSAYLVVKTIPFPLLISNPSARGHRPGYEGRTGEGTGVITRRGGAFVQIKK